MTASALSRPSMPTLEDVILAIEKAENITREERKGLVLDIRSACCWFGLEPESVIAHPANLNPRFRRLSPGGIGVSPKRILKVGPVGEPIGKVADTGKFDLLVMGSHGHGALATLVMGSVTTQVLANCKVPVLIVR